MQLTPRRHLAPESASQPAPCLPVARKPGEPFNPVGLFHGIFIPEAICKYRGLPLGAKMVYGRLCRYAGRDAAVYVWACMVVRRNESKLEQVPICSEGH